MQSGISRRVRDMPKSLVGAHSLQNIKNSARVFVKTDFGFLRSSCITFAIQRVASGTNVALRDIRTISATDRSALSYWRSIIAVQHTPKDSQS